MFFTDKLFCHFCSILNTQTLEIVFPWTPGANVYNSAMTLKLALTLLLFFLN